MSFRNKLAFLTSIISFFFLIPGVYLSILTIKTSGTVAAPEMEAKFGVRFFDTTNSILKTVHDLFTGDYKFVACMIFLFSVIVPAIKGLLLIYVLITKDSTIRKKIFAFIKSIGKWSMCDVFIAATFLAYLSSGSKSHGEHHEVVVSGYQVGVDVMVKMSAHLQIGFYCFLAYCLLSLVALQLYEEY
jgi:hypothetical protein